GCVEGALEHGFVEVMAAELAVGCAIVTSRRKDPLPGPLALGKWILVEEGAGELDVPRVGLEVLAVSASHLFEVSLQWGSQSSRQQGDSIAVALSIADDELPGAEVDVLHA